MTSPPVPAPVAEALARFPAPVRARLHEIRELVFATAASDESVGPLCETLKWGEPAYLTQTSRSGVTIRLGATKANPDKCAVLFNCRTPLVAMFREQFATEFDFEGNRALLIATSGRLPLEPLALCLHMALTWRRRKKP